MPDLATLELEHSDDVVIARIEGEMDLSNTQDLSAELTAGIPNTAQAVILDLSDTEYLDSAAIRTLFDLSDRCRIRQQQFILVIPETMPMRRMLGIVGIERAGPVLPSLAAARAQLEATGAHGTSEI